MSRLSRLGFGAAVLSMFACASTSITTSPRSVQLSGTFAGIQDGINAGVAFQDEQVIFLLIETGDSTTGTYDVTGIAGGDFRASIDRTNGVFIDFVMEQNDPCPGTFTGQGEARAGIGFGGEVTVGIAGSYEGTDCNGDVDVDFFVQN